jgi:hypothetical protein
MQITDTLTFWGNLIGLFAVGAKTTYDLYFNPRSFKTDQKSMALIEAAKKKRERADLSTALTFLVVGIGYAFSILALIKF